MPALSHRCCTTLRTFSPPEISKKASRAMLRFGALCKTQKNKNYQKLSNAERCSDLWENILVRKLQMTLTSKCLHTWQHTSDTSLVKWKLHKSKNSSSDIISLLKIQSDQTSDSMVPVLQLSTRLSGADWLLEGTREVVVQPALVLYSHHVCKCLLLGELPGSQTDDKNVKDLSGQVKSAY